MPLDDLIVSRAIIDEYRDTLVDALNVDVAIAGGGPAGLVAGYYLAQQGYKVSLFERKLSLGGGMWGGGIMFNKIVLQEAALDILKEFNISYKKYQDNYYVANSTEAVGSLVYHAAHAGVQLFNCMSIEDIKITSDDAVCGLVVNWTSVELTRMHVDPITFGSKFVIDATGHTCDIANIVLQRIGKVLFTPTGDIMGEGSMNAELAENDVAENAREIYKNLYVTGMAGNAIWGSKRMGPIFGGMLLSGKKVADDIAERLAKETVNA